MDLETSASKPLRDLKLKGEAEGLEWMGRRLEEKLQVEQQGALFPTDCAERGEMRLNAPVAQYLPARVKLPGRNGTEITVQQLAAHTSGLPRDIQHLASPNPHNPFDYTAEQLYAFLSSYSLTDEPGTKFRYSNLGMGLLGQAIVLATRTNYESLVLKRICRPLDMNDTCATLSSELKPRLAAGHDASGKWVSNYEFQSDAMAGCGALRSTANDLLKMYQRKLA